MPPISPDTRMANQLLSNRNREPLVTVRSCPEIFLIALLMARHPPAANSNIAVNAHPNVCTRAPTMRKMRKEDHSRRGETEGINDLPELASHAKALVRRNAAIKRGRRHQRRNASCP